MPNLVYFVLFVLGCVRIASQQGVGSGDNGNLRVCVVEGRGSYKRAGRFCPVLDEESAGVECVIGTDRLDCLRRMGKGTVDFGAFSPEDLVAAQWAQLDVLVTDELRSRPRQYERSIVAVVNRRVFPADARLSLRAGLANTTLCHQGHGGDDSRALSDTLTEYLESLLVERSCEPTLSLAEDRVRSLAGYFARACIAGPWVPDGPRDAELKAKYPSLCAACGGSQCRAGDRYWGVTGALACLAEGAGDVTWAHLDDVEAFFGLGGAAAFSPPEQFAYLCRDGSLQPLAAPAPPCAWLHVPWPVVVAKRKAAAAVSGLAQSLTNASVAADVHWRGALAALLDVHRPVEPLSPARAPLDHLASAPGFREAYSRTGCSPPRHITVCTTSLLEKNKCEWLSEAAAVHGAAPPLQCALRPGGTRDCLSAVQAGECDVTVAPSDWLVPAQRDYAVTPVLLETTPIIEQTSTVVAYVRQSTSMPTSLDQLKGKRASFPRFDGFAWHAVSQYLAEKEGTPCDRAIREYFGDICAPGVQGRNLTEAAVRRLTKGCYQEDGEAVEGELQALRALVEGRSDVAFLSLGTYHRYSEGKLVHEPWAKEITKLVPLCPESNRMYCFLSWSSLGHVYASNNITHMRRQEIINVFEKADQLFGKKIPFRNAMFSLYGPFNHQPDILFHNNTRTLATAAVLFTHPYDKIPLSFERTLTADSCLLNTAAAVTDLAHLARPSTALMALVSLVLIVLGR